MKKLIIIGAGGFGREVLGYAEDMIEAGQASWEIAGFIDDNLQALRGYSIKYRVLDTIAGHKITKENVYICAIGNPYIKKEICEDFLKKGAQFINIVHPTARLGRTNRMGTGNVFCPQAVLTENITIGNFAFLNCHSDCGHDAIIEDFVTISAYCDIMGYASVKEGAFLGSHASICPGITVGAFSVIGAGACVIHDIPDGVTAVGVPARVIKKNERGQK